MTPEQQKRMEELANSYPYTLGADWRDNALRDAIKHGYRNAVKDTEKEASPLVDALENPFRCTRCGYRAPEKCGRSCDVVDDTCDWEYGFKEALAKYAGNQVNNVEGQGDKDDN